MTQDDIDREEWDKPTNWGDGPFGLYFSKRDSRTWVPRRPAWLGWTLNFGHRHAAHWLTGMMLFPVLMVILLWILVTVLEAEAVVFIASVFVPLMLISLVGMMVVASRSTSKRERGKKEQS